MSITYKIVVIFIFSFSCQCIAQWSNNNYNNNYYDAIGYMTTSSDCVSGWTCNETPENDLTPGDTNNTEVCRSPEGWIINCENSNTNNPGNGRSMQCTDSGWLENCDEEDTNTPGDTEEEEQPQCSGGSGWLTDCDEENTNNPGNGYDDGCGETGWLNNCQDPNTNTPGKQVPINNYEALLALTAIAIGGITFYRRQKQIIKN